MRSPLCPLTHRQDTAGAQLLVHSFLRCATLRPAKEHSWRDAGAAMPCCCELAATIDSGVECGIQCLQQSAHDCMLHPCTLTALLTHHHTQPCRSIIPISSCAASSQALPVSRMATAATGSAARDCAYRTQASLTRTPRISLVFCVQSAACAPNVTANASSATPTCAQPHSCASAMR